MNFSYTHPNMSSAGSAEGFPLEWAEIEHLTLSGLIMVAGGPDSGKTTLMQHLSRRFLAENGQTAEIDADPGQSRLGPPATFTLSWRRALAAGPEAEERRWQRFVGAVSPRGHMLQVLAACGRLVEKAREIEAGRRTSPQANAPEAKACPVLMDTSGLVAPKKGGARLKLAKIDLLQPDVVIALQKGGELESWLRPLRISRRTRLIDLPSARSVCPRDLAQRQAYREAVFRSYFKAASEQCFYWPDYGVFPELDFFRQRLVAFEDAAGFVLGLGIVTACDRGRRSVSVWTPLRQADKERTDSINLGDLTVDPQTFAHASLAPAAATPPARRCTP